VLPRLHPLPLLLVSKIKSPPQFSSVEQKLSPSAFWYSAHSSGVTTQISDGAGVGSGVIRILQQPQSCWLFPSRPHPWPSFEVSKTPPSSSQNSSSAHKSISFGLNDPHEGGVVGHLKFACGTQHPQSPSFPVLPLLHPSPLSLVMKSFPIPHCSSIAHTPATAEQSSGVTGQSSEGAGVGSGVGSGVGRLQQPQDPSFPVLPRLHPLPLLLVSKIKSPPQFSSVEQKLSPSGFWYSAHSSGVTIQISEGTGVGSGVGQGPKLKLISATWTIVSSPPSASKSSLQLNHVAKPHSRFFAFAP